MADTVQGAKRILVCGGRDYADAPQLREVLDNLLALHSPLVLIAGGARGADSLAADWARARPDHVELIVEKANWQRHGKAAGAIRNQKMLDHHHPDLVVAFPGGRGTADMVAKARTAGIEVFWPVPPAQAPTAPQARLRAS